MNKSLQQFLTFVFYNLLTSPETFKIFTADNFETRMFFNSTFRQGGGGGGGKKELTFKGETKKLAKLREDIYFAPRFFIP